MASMLFVLTTLNHFLTESPPYVVGAERSDSLVRRGSVCEL